MSQFRIQTKYFKRKPGKFLSHAKADSWEDLWLKVKLTWIFNAKLVEKTLCTWRYTVIKTEVRMLREYACSHFCSPSSAAYPFWRALFKEVITPMYDVCNSTSQSVGLQTLHVGSQSQTGKYLKYWIGL